MNTRTDDHYPTRLDHAIPPIPRIEPGVWGSADQGPLDDEALQSYANGGYLIRPRTVGPDWLPPLSMELNRLGANSITMTRGSSASPVAASARCSNRISSAI